MLATLAGWKYGFDSPFKAEVYFVSTRQITDLKWGTPNPVMMRDADFGPVRVRGFGTYTLRAKDPKRCSTQLVGTDARFEADEIHELLRAIDQPGLRRRGRQVGVRAARPGLSTTPMLSEQVRRVRERIDDEYGLEIPQLVIVNVSVPAEVEQALDARTSMGVIGDLAAYQSYQLGALDAGGRRQPGRRAGRRGRRPGHGHGDRRPLRRRRGRRSVRRRRRPPAGTSPSRPSVGPLSLEELARAAAGPRHARHARVVDGHARLDARARACRRSRALFGGPRRCRAERRLRLATRLPPVARELRHEREQLERVRRRRVVAELAVERRHVHGDPLGVAPRRVVVERDRARGLLAVEARPRSSAAPRSAM